MEDKIGIMRALKTLTFLVLVTFIAGCEAESAGLDSPSGGGVGQTGSLARFAIVKDRLYMADGWNLNTYRINDLANPIFSRKTRENFVLQTLFARDTNILFAGGDAGMAIYDVSAGYPVMLDMYQHIQSCDPVVADETHAYVTLNSNSGCNGVSQLDILNVTNLTNIQLVNTRPMDNPKGLCIKGDRLYVCNNGIDVFDISNRDNPIFLRKLAVGDAVDIIAYKETFFITTPTGVRIIDIQESGEVVNRSVLW